MTNEFWNAYQLYQTYFQKPAQKANPAGVTHGTPVSGGQWWRFFNRLW